jgi:REP element-mobilizing transposase RayT
MKVEYNNLYTHFIFTTFLREAVILNKNRARIEKYITGIIANNNCQLYAIYANPEHMHFLVSRSPGIDEERLAGIIANSSANFINKNKLCTCIFQWQMSCSAFSVSKKEVDSVCKYILNQPQHHKKQSFKDEYDSFIKFYQKSIKPK